MTSSSSSLSPRRGAQRELARSQATFLSEQILSLREKNAHLEQDNQQVVSQFKTLSQMNTTLGDDLRELNEEVAWLERQIQPLAETHAKLESQRAHLQSLIAALRAQILADERGQDCVTKIRRFESRASIALAELRERRPGEPLAELEEAKLALSEAVEELQEEQKDLEAKRELLGVLLGREQTFPEKVAALEEVRLAKEEEARALRAELAALPQAPFAPRRPKRAPALPQPRQTDSEKIFHETRRQKLLSQYKPEEESSTPSPMPTPPPTSMPTTTPSPSPTLTPSPTPTPTPSPAPEAEPAPPAPAPAPEPEPAPPAPAAAPKPDRKPQNSSDLGTQTIEAEMAPFVSARLEEAIDQCKRASAQIERAAVEFDAKKREIHDGRQELESNITVLSQSAVVSLSITPRRGPVQALGLVEFKRRSQAVVTEVTGAILDLHRETLEKQLADVKVVRDLKDSIENLRKQLKQANRQLYTAKKQSKLLDEKIRQTKEDVRKARTEADLEEQNRLLALQKDEEDRLKDVQMAADVRHQQRLLAQREKQIEEVAVKLEELNRMKESLEFDLEDMTHREKLDVQALIHTVGVCDGRADDTRQKLRAAEEELNNKQQIRAELKHSEDFLSLRDLIIRKSTLERRIEKWNGILRNPRESLQVMIDFSAVNALRRQHLVASLKKAQRTKLSKEEELRELENYIALLNELLREQNEHWR
jgi:prefoldin subunit 5